MFNVTYWNILNMRFQDLLMYKFLNYVQFCTDCRKYLWTLSCDVCTDPAAHLPVHVIWMYPQIISNINIFMTWWNNFCFNDEAWNMQQWFGLISLFVFQLQTLFSIHFFMSEVYLLLWKKHYQHNIQVKIWTHTLPLSFSFG